MRPEQSGPAHQVAGSPGRTVDVCHIAFGGLGGHGAIVKMLAQQFAEHDLHSAVMLWAPPDDIDDNPDNWPHLDPIIRAPTAGKFDLRALAHVTRSVRKLRPRIVLCHTHQPIVAAFIGQLLAGRRPHVVIVEHQAIGLRRRIENLRSTIALIVCQAVVVLSDDYRDRYPLRRWPLPALRNLTVIANGIDTNRYTPSNRSTHTSDDRPFTVGMGCRFIPIKDLDTLIDAFALLAKRNDQSDHGDRTKPNVMLRLAGDGPTRAELMAQTATLGLGRTIEFTGQLDDQQMVNFYASLDVYVQASLGETASISLLEAYACGLAVVASDVEGIRGFVDDGVDGLLVAVRDPAAIAAAIESLMANPQRVRELGAAARQRAESHFSAATMADAYIALFEKIGA